MSADDTLHVAPVGDGVEHDTSTDQAECVCGPAVEFLPGDGVPDGWIIVHHALDGRG